MLSYFYLVLKQFEKKNHSASSLRLNKYYNIFNSSNSFRNFYSIKTVIFAKKEKSFSLLNESKNEQI